MLVPDIYRVRAAVFMAGLMKVLRWASAVKGTGLDVAQVRLVLAFAAVGHIVQRRRLPTPGRTGVTMVDLSDMPDAVVAPLRAYLCETAGFDPTRAFDEQSSWASSEEHGLVVVAGSRDLESFLQ